MARLSNSRMITLLDVAAVGFIAAAWEWQVFSDGKPFGTHVIGPRWFMVMLPALIALPLLWRRRMPLRVCTLVMTGIALQAIVSGDSPEGLGLILLWLLVPFSVAAYTAPREGLIGLGVTLAAFAIYAADNADITSGRAGDVWAGAFFLVAAVGSWMAGAVLHGRRQRATLESRARTLEQATRVAVDEERSRIARELHDIVSHNLSVVVVQAAGARAQAPPHDPGATTLEKIERSGREALMEMRRLLGVLRSAEDDGRASLTPSPGIADLPTLAEDLRHGGVDVELTLETVGASLPSAIEVSGYRIVQEALTNTLKHAGPGAHARVRVAQENGALIIEVEDDGGRRAPGESSSWGGGHGLIGIRERAALFGGEAHAQPQTGGGFILRARLPLDSGPPQ